MPYVIGADEAGYGPNLGPLVVSATLWEVPDALNGADLYEVLQQVVSASPRGGDRRIAIADSKQLYKGGGGLAALERGVLTALTESASGRDRRDALPWRWRDVWKTLDCDSLAQLDAIPWYQDYDAPIPYDFEIEQLHRAKSWFRSALQRSGVRLGAIASTVVFPQRFNEAIDRHGTKGTALSIATLQLIAKLLAPLGDGSTRIVCDKHGGRNKYGPLLQQTFPDDFVEVRHESRGQSVYRWGPSNRRVEIRFVAKGERFLSAALASMVSKYLRQLAMQAFNHFWRRHLPHLKPTAGYPVDARRFKADIAAMQQKLGIDDHILWRKR